MAAGHGPSVGREGAGGIRGRGWPWRSRGSPSRTRSPYPPPYPYRGPRSARTRAGAARRAYEGEPPCSCCCRPPKERPPRGAGLP
ncbi:hypothetical protein F5983_01690 [Streptomyces arboris]|uniref:Uncharacterized protein n=1 Tax=Streptomyces arboris TaxID=2600619 RepID=A0A5N5ETW8_9ACTN|nr:hypothetical protein F5983_01690 [Streptomyces arboris]